MKTLILAAAIVLCIGTHAYAGTSNVSLAWDASASPDVAGYRIYTSQTPGQYTYGHDNAAAEVTKENLTATVEGLNDGTVYFVATAFDAKGNESGPSNEVNVTLDATAPDAPGGLNITVTVKVQVQ